MADRATERVSPASTDLPAGRAGVGVRDRRSGLLGRLLPGRRRGYSLLGTRDKVVLGLMVGIPSLIVLVFIWLPTFASVALSFTDWNGITPLEQSEFVGLENYRFLIEDYRPFWPAIQHNIIWLAFLALIASPLGMFLAVLLDKNIRGTRFYQSVLYLPVMISLAVVGFIWQLQYGPEDGFINNVLGTNRQGNLISWLGDPAINIWAVLVAASWRHVGYIMVLYLAGLKSVDPSLREAAAMDGANQRQTFFHVVFPVMKPINIVIIVITAIEALRAFDLAFIINRGLNGLELLSILVTNNIIGEASRVGFGSSIAVILLLISVPPIIIFLSRAMREERAS